MSTVIITVVTALVVCVIYSLIHKGWYRNEIEILHNKVNGVAGEAQIAITDVKNKAQNAQAIASNALSSAQKAKSKIEKRVEGIISQGEGLIQEVKKNA